MYKYVYTSSEVYTYAPPPLLGDLLGVHYWGSIVGDPLYNT